ncbi:hypothetical protein [Nocardia farcinica]|uniref:hypothetical protein n=1 Tax=Nocardia farcinica TaxID=37329 RepID=UPI001892E715|nr:hypothetical protein [Nocardia farcinica]MBF6068101.1 hypothetical protein [Nocardia farcinica]MBF6231779.1 hypothetical protein [Nocardia farcinica]MBF6375788.1 hypothetical protein [Nocardia farcinica]MBF6573215.1 hypothetical protein [Nocardia farcinica]MCZ9329005.1 hypothetical protein [Nocardia farcinica]
MADDLSGQARQWKQLKEDAVNGSFQLDDEIGTALMQRCETLLGELDNMTHQVAQLNHLSGYGGLPSALALQTKFERKAAGGGDHDPNDSALARLQQHIEVVKLMRDTYAAAIGKLQQTDQSAAGEMNAQTEGVG